MVVKTTYALTLFTAVSLAAPMQKGGSGGSENFIGAGTANGQVNDVVKGLFKELTPRDSDDGGSSKHGNILDSIPLIGDLLGGSGNQEKRSFTGDLANFPLLGELFGGDQAHPANTPSKEKGARSYDDDLNDVPFAGGLSHEGQNHGQNHGQNAGQNYGQNAGQNYKQNYGQNYGQNAGQNAGQNEGENYGQNFGQNDGENYGQNYLQNFGQNHKRDLEGDLSSLPIIGSLFSGDDKDTKDSKDTKGNKDSDDKDDKTPSEEKKLDSRQFEGIWTLVHGLTSGAVLSRDMSNDEAKKPGQEAQPQDAQSDKEIKPAKPSKSNNPLAELASESGLGQLFGNAHHGVGLLPMNGRRDTSSIELRAAPIQGSTLTDVLLQGGALGKISKALAPQPAGPPGKSDPTKIGDGSGMAPPGAPGSPPGSAAAGPHHGPGYIAEHKKQN
ncbi:hypothetical protein N7493_003552 [Penicillium malachiteum]|uniref:Uncharacterized protein n=1 Tax=Penicillium malachiteum TaxID=1324776 RepID=A0AAD6HQI4_9EURO|nr:hypothetical protein N7493_003552 [Penicillium malachiteum]